MKTIYLDLDGVLFDFDTRINEIFKGNIPTDKKVFWDTLKCYPDIYSELKPYNFAQEFVAQVRELSVKHNYALCILTAIPLKETIPLAEQHKRKAVYSYFGVIEFKIGPHAKDKQNHYKDGDILIDDKESNINEWKVKGGKAILHSDFNITLSALQHLIIKASINETYILQTLFSNAYTGLKNQGWMQSGTRGNCKYRYNNLKCAIGHSIRPENYTEHLEGLSVFSLVDQYIHESVLDALNIKWNDNYKFANILRELQHCHDTPAISIKQSLEVFAEKYSLTIPDDNYQITYL